MKETTVSIAEGKKGFSRLVEEAHKNKEDTIVTKRGKPVAVIIPYDEYKRSKRVEGHRKIMEARAAFLKAGIGAEEVFKESKKQLEKRR
ncbi:MAG: type II toxin-antitoxin system Phd/YefM family antitoxin [Candidatus Aminicenantes bacterium]|jgi:prevent-host-death family protein|nr:type II toxin-antitoxin system prevent-host-death family antitoxin [bacterium]TET70886.1 MAG: type II toxin-antitoxin system Phd/YefM family antitoxin [Candidatus Aminicenantes bacterium]TEU06700.1 MAG: type II toxin-antitoxin system Phd/YefM family antitoxin [Candidatus Aminicenantes bacterium]